MIKLNWIELDSHKSGLQFLSLMNRGYFDGVKDGRAHQQVDDVRPEDPHVSRHTGRHDAFHPFQLIFPATGCCRRRGWVMESLLEN